MIDARCVSFLEKKFGEHPYSELLQDFTNEDVKKVIAENAVNNRFKLIEIFYEHSTDEEVRAHLKGFKSASERTLKIQRLKELQERCK